jgi:ketosteroid isomerase-like protein
VSRENVEVVRRIYEYYGATRDFLEEDFQPEFVWDMSTFRWPERQTYAGLDGAREFMTNWIETWEEWEFEVEELHDAGDSVVGVVS